MRERFLAFVAEQAPFALELAATAFDQVVKAPPASDKAIEDLRAPVAEAIRSAALRESSVFLNTTAKVVDVEATPGVHVRDRLTRGVDALVDACDGFLRREAIALSLTKDERIEILRGMLLTRALDTRLKQFFSGSEVRFEGTPFQGKGFRSLGQEAIYAAVIRLRRGARWRGDDGSWRGDVIGPIIRDVGAALGMRPEPATIRMVLNAQMGKAGPPMDGRDLHIGDFDWGIVPATAPLSISSLTIAGMGLAFSLTHAEQVAVSFIGEGGSSLGEWHEAINMCAARRLPVIFCLQNNQTALSTPVPEQSAVRVFADKAVGYGIPGVTLDGTDPEAIAAAFTWAAERARAGRGPALLELVAMRMCGHAHHDDMLYLGKDPQPSWEYPPLTPQGYADPDLYKYWAARDPIAVYAVRLKNLALIKPGDLDQMKQDAEAQVEAEAQAVIGLAWPDPATVTSGVIADDPVARGRVEVLDRDDTAAAATTAEPLTVEQAPPFDRKGMTFLEAVMLGVGDALAADPRAFVFGQDVGGKYGNAFLLLRPLLEKYGDRILNSPLAEGAVLGACVGAALAGLRPIGEMQFNDFVATGFNQLVNNAAKIRYRWGGSVPMVVRMPWGGLRHAGPYHSQNTEPWFYRTPGLKIVVPSTPFDARALMASAVADPDPVLYYEHIALYRDPRIRQAVESTAPAPLPVGRAALRRTGDDLAIISYGAYVPSALRVADRLHDSGIDASVLDLRWLAPLDRGAVLSLARRTGRVLIVHEDSRTGGIGESLAAVIQESVFEWLDAPVRIIGALDTPVPYSPPLEAAFLPSEAEIEHAARKLVEY
ncbi:MAG TPA: thiamine pyrophosphate-dependent enzyme [Vicinamibacterales bacterium]|nr:thiamine pyrophosphate-dependent enzyme [Vicinamibacterales bacterium]